MSDLLKKIKHLKADAALKLQEAGMSSDSDIRTLTRQDLQELFPGAQNLRLRKNIFDAINKQRTIHVVVKELQKLIPREPLGVASSGVLVDYLHLLKDMKTQMNNVQTFLDAHIDLLEDIYKTQPDPKPDEGSLSYTTEHQVEMEFPTRQKDNLLQGAGSLSGMNQPSVSSAVAARADDNRGNRQKTRGSLSDTTEHQVEMEFPTRQKDNLLQGAGSLSGMNQPSVSSAVAARTDDNRGNRQKTRVAYKMVVSGKTFDAHLHLLDKVKSLECNLDLVNVEESRNNEDCQITIVFCPNVSRIGTDIDAAMSSVRDDKPVILVVMHHVREAKPVTAVRTWSSHYKVVLYVNVFYHDTMGGLLKCQQNSDAASEIQKELLKHGTKTPYNTSGKAEGGITTSGYLLVVSLVVNVSIGSADGDNDGLMSMTTSKRNWNRNGGR
ncbi:uncharacterized protein [Brachyistius frenatus]|uniref:uncharacterized protein isoform X1 n=1 Tax=Brachyistius frenatus TaxID=100188 RepID=UPI0037E83F48